MQKFKEIVERVDSQSIFESSFSAGKMKKVSDILAQVLGKDLGGTFKQLGGSFGYEEFKKNGGVSGKGYKYGNSAGYMIRFGWLDKNKSMFQINSVDLWVPGSGASWEKPTKSVRLYDWMNIVDVVNELKEILVHDKMPEILKESVKSRKSSIHESVKSPPSKKLIAYAEFKNVKYIPEEDSYHGLIAKIKAAGSFDEDELKGFKVTKNEVEQNTTSATIKKAEALLSSRKFADPEIVFTDIEKLTKVVALGLQNALVVAGMAGIGKCHVGTTVIPVKGL